MLFIDLRPNSPGRKNLSLSFFGPRIINYATVEVKLRCCPQLLKSGKLFFQLESELS